MKKKEKRSNVILSILSGLILSAFIILAVSSSPIEEFLLYDFLINYDCSPAEDKWEYTETIQFEDDKMIVTSGYKDDYGRWHGTLYKDIYYALPNGDVHLWSCKIPSRYGKYHGQNEISYYINGEFRNKKYNVWRDGELVTETVEAGKSAPSDRDHSAYEYYIAKNLENTAMLMMAGYDSLYIRDYFAALEEELYAESFGTEDFDDHYEAAIDVLSETPFDSIIGDSEMLIWLNALKIARDNPFRLAVIDQLLEGEEQSMNVLASRYAGFVDILMGEGISESDLSEFCRQFDSCMVSYGSLDMEDPYLVDSIDIRIYTAIFALYESGEGDELVKRALDPSLTGISGLSDMRKHAVSFLEEEVVFAEVPEVAEIILYTIFMAFLEADEVKNSVYETWVRNTGTPVLPQVATGDLEGLSATSISVKGHILYNGGEGLSEQGVVWGESHDPVLDGNKQSSNSSADSFQIVISGLEEGHSYYARAYATNSLGTAYGSSVSFVAGEASGVEAPAGNQAAIHLFPNPVRDLVSVHFSLDRQADIYLCLYDLNGREVLVLNQGDLPAGSHMIEADLSGLASGSYICRIMNGNQTIASTKLIVSK